LLSRINSMAKVAFYGQFLHTILGLVFYLQYFLVVSQYRQGLSV
jgi:hypothetical protein